MIITDTDVYTSYIKAQCKYLSAKFEIVKKLETLPKTNQKNIETICGNFNTKWQNIDIDRYFDCGFSIFSSKFNIRKILDPIILKVYIENDRKIKIKPGITKIQFDKEIKFIERWMGQRTHNRDKNLMDQYGCFLEDGIKAPIKHYISNKISKYILVWLMSQHHVIITEEEKRLVPLVIQNYWLYTKELIELGVGKIYGNKTT